MPITITKGRFIIYALVIILLIISISRTLKRVKINSEDYYQRRLAAAHDRIHGDTIDEYVTRTIQLGAQVPNPRPIDNYRIGDALLINRDLRNAHQQFQNALNAIINTNRIDDYTAFIIERIDDYKDEFAELPDLPDLPLQHALVHYYETQAKAKVKTVDPNDEHYKQKVMLQKVAWVSDNQNVHDQTMSAEFKQQFNKILDENEKILGIHTRTYEDAMLWIESQCKNPADHDKYKKIKHILDQKYLINVGDRQIPEQEVLIAVWRRAHAKENESQKDAIKRAIVDAVLDCVEHEHSVCIAGRTVKIWQALACLDADPEIGKLRTKQVIRNEIYERCAKIINDKVGVNGGLPESIKSAYQKDEPSDLVLDLKNSMYKEIEDIRADYVDKIPGDMLDLIIDECKMTV